MKGQFRESREVIPSQRSSGGIELEAGKRKAPPAKHLGRAELLEWSRLWSSPVSDLWSAAAGDDVLVERLAELRAALRAKGAANVPASMLAAVGVLEDKLLIGPKARGVRGIVLAEAEPTKRNGRAALDAATRRQLERDLAPVKR